MNDSDTIDMLSRYSDERMQSCRRCYLQSFDVCNARFACDEFDGWLITSQTGVHDDISRDVFQLRWNKYKRMNATTRRIAIKCVSVGYSWLSGFELLIDDILFQSLWCDGNTKCWSKCVRRSSVFALLVESVVVDECGVGDCLLDKSASAFHSKQMKEKDTSNVLACACRSDNVVVWWWRAMFALLEWVRNDKSRQRARWRGLSRWVEHRCFRWRSRSWEWFWEMTHQWL